MIESSSISRLAKITLSMFLLTSCDRPKQLLEENARLEIRLKNGWEEMRAIDVKLLALGTDTDTAIIILQRRCKELEDAIDKETLEITKAAAVISRLESELKPWRPRIDLYKTKFAY